MRVIHTWLRNAGGTRKIISSISAPTNAEATRTGAGGKRWQHLPLARSGVTVQF
jgi:hypothetical protein